MAQNSTRNANDRSFAARATRQDGGGAAHSTPSLRMTEMLPSARDLQIVDSTLSMVGGDIVHNHYYPGERPRDIWAMLKSIPNFRAIYHDMLSKATSGTGMWLFKGDKFRLWLEPNGDIRIFWGSGIAGAGKTLLASLVIEHLEVLRQEAGGAICVCYVYFRYSDRAEVTVRGILAILVKQTLERHPSCLGLIENTYAQHLREGSEPTEAQLLGLLRQLVDQMTCAFYVLDALDEAPTRIQLAVVKVLASLNVKLFITSRPLQVVEANFQDAHTFVIIAQDSDIDLHISKRLAESANLMNLIQCIGPSLREEIISTIKQKCGGMSLHASLQLEALCQCISTREVLHTLHSFPPKIEDVYLQTWERILKQQQDHVLVAKAMLMWVLTSSRPMAIEELERAVATSPETHKLEPNRIVPGTTLTSLCHGLVVVEDVSHIVRLVHYTAKDTLEGLLRESYPHPHSLLAAICTTHLTECGFQNTAITSEEGFRTALNNDPLLTYASDAWAFHVCAGLNVEQTKHQAAQFIKECHALPALTTNGLTTHFDILAPFHIAGLYKLPMALIEGVIMGNPNSTTTVHQQTPLIVASRSGHEDLAAYLLALPETDVNLVDDAWNSALMQAVYAGHAGVIKLLLAHPRIQVNLRDNDGRSALMLAALTGRVSVVRYLLGYPGVQANLRDNNGFSAFMLAAFLGHEHTLKLLLSYPGIEVNQREAHGFSALMLAAIVGHEQIIKPLLAYPGIQVNLVGNDGWSALMQAAYSGHESIIKLFFAHPEIQVNLVHDKGWPMLMEAASRGHEGAAKLLAYPGIQVNLVGNGGWSALMQAAHAGHEAGVKLLLANPEIQVNLVKDDGWSALMLASCAGHKSIVKLLLMYPEIMVNLVDDKGWSALLHAANQGHEGVIKLLLAHPRIQANLVDIKGWSALLLGARTGHIGAVKLLLAYPGTQVNLASNYGSTALSLATEFGQSSVVELLLTTDAFDINALDKHGDTAIKLAAKEGHDAIVRMLLNTPHIDTTIEGTGDRHTAMSAAQANGHIYIVELLREIDEDSSDSDGEETYFDAEEGAEEDGILCSPILA